LKQRNVIITDEEVVEGEEVVEEAAAVEADEKGEEVVK
jgi:hypothetical protein